MNSLVEQGLLALARERQDDLHDQRDRIRLTGRTAERAGAIDAGPASVRWMSVVQGFMSAPAAEPPPQRPRSRSSSSQA